MRVEQLVGSYTNNQKKPDLKKSGRLRPMHRGKVLRGTVLDVVCISAEEFEQDFGWFSAYVHQLPDDIVAEKIKQIFHRQPTSLEQADDSLVEKLLFEVF
jgi:hypothetical protein